MAYDELNENEQNELMRKAWASNQDNPDRLPDESIQKIGDNDNNNDSVIEDQATRSVAGFAKPDKALLSASEIIEEAKEEDEEKKEEREEKREQTVRVVIDKPKPKKKQKFEEGLTDEEKKEYKAMRMDEKRTMLSERKLRLEQRKRKVEDERFKRDISPEQFGTYRKAKMLMGDGSQAPRRAQAPVQARAESKAWTPNAMMGAVRGVRNAKPYNPVIASQGRRADYMNGRNLTRGGAVGKPRSIQTTHMPHADYSSRGVKSIQANRMPRADYFKGFGKSKARKTTPFQKFGAGKFGHNKKKIKSRWRKLW